MTQSTSRDSSEYRTPIRAHMILDPEVQFTSHETDEAIKARLRATHTAPSPPFAAMAGWVLLICALVLLVAQWDLYPQSLTGQNNANRALGVSIVASAAGLRILFGQYGRHAVAALLALFAGAGLVAQAGLLPHDGGHTAAMEAVTGTLIFLAATTALVSPQVGPTTTPDQTVPPPTG